MSFPRASDTPLIFGNENLTFEGALERSDDGWAIGWVWIPVQPLIRLTVEIVLAGQAIAAGVANLPRDDLAATGRGDGNYGFRIPLTIESGQEIHARIANAPFQLPDSPFLNGTPVLSRGSVDHAFGLTVKGWCWVPAEPQRIVLVTALFDGHPVASTASNQFRADLAAAGIGDGNHAFVLKLPLALADGIIRSVSLVAEDGRELTGSPVEILAVPAGPLAVLEETRRAVGEGDKGQIDHGLGLLGAYLERVEELIPQSLPWREYERWRPLHPKPSHPEPTIAKGSLTLLPSSPGIVALLDSGAELLPGALARAVEAFTRGQADLLYGDAEADTPLGPIPWFRPDWNYDLFLSQDYMRGLVLIRSALLKHLPPSATLAETLVRAVEAARPTAIHHLPEVLTRLTARADTADQWLAAINGHLIRSGRGARADMLPSGDRRLHWLIPESAPGVSLIIPTRDRLDLLAPCIESIRRLTRYPMYEIIVIDNQSRENETLLYLAEGQAAGLFRVLSYDAPFNFSAMNNEAAKIARGAILGFINNDVELISPGWLEEAVGLLARPEVGAVGAKLRFANGMIQHAGVILGIDGAAENAFQHLHGDERGYFNRTNVTGSYSAVTAACLFIRTDEFLALGGFDSINLPVAFNDVDLCLRLGERGLSIVYTPFIELYHHESANRGREHGEQRQLRFLKETTYLKQRWRSLLLRDPFYNPNLNLDTRPFTGLAFPSRHRWGGGKKLGS